MGRTREPQVTVVLTEYRRRDNMETILTALYNQTEPIRIIYINNSGHAWASAVLGANDLYVSMPDNGGAWARLLMSVYATTPYVIWWSDDFIPATGMAVERLVKLAAQHPGRVVGIHGHGLNKVSPYYDKMDNQDGFVPIVKGTVLAFQRTELRRVPIDCNVRMVGDEFLRRCDDLHLSLSLGNGKPVHFVDSSLERDVTEVVDDLGLCREPEHYAVRNEFCRIWFSYGWHGLGEK